MSDESEEAQYLAYIEGSQPQANADAILRARAKAHAEEVLAAEAMETVRTARIKRTMGEFLDQPKPAELIAEVLAAEMNTLGGPSEAGKSLLARDWALHIAAGVPWHGHAVEQRNVLWIASEGLHDADMRWGEHPLWDLAKDRVWVLDPIDLTSPADVEWLISEYAEEQPGIVVFDVIYGMGMAEDTGTKDAIPVITAMKRISAVWRCATLALGHPGHNGERRFRGTSMWRQLTYTEWHMAEGLLTCEKSKLADKTSFHENYAVEYPEIKWLTRQQARGRRDDRRMLIEIDIETNPNDTIRRRAERLAPALGVGFEAARKLISEAVRK